MVQRALDWLFGTGRAVRSLLILLTMLTPILATALDVQSGYAESPAVWFWGDYPVGVSGPCDDPGVTTSRPTAIPGLSDVASLAGNLDQVIALKTDGTVWTWGSDASHVAKLSQVPDLSDVTAIAAGSGGTFALALKADGTVWAWGRQPPRRAGDRTERR